MKAHFIPATETVFDSRPVQQLCADMESLTSRATHESRPVATGKKRADRMKGDPHRRMSPHRRRQYARQSTRAHLLDGAVHSDGQGRTTLRTSKRPSACKRVAFGDVANIVIAQRGRENPEKTFKKPARVCSKGAQRRQAATASSKAPSTAAGSSAIPHQLVPSVVREKTDPVMPVNVTTQAAPASSNLPLRSSAAGDSAIPRQSVPSVDRAKTDLVMPVSVTTIQGTGLDRTAEIRKPLAKVAITATTELAKLRISDEPLSEAENLACEAGVGNPSTLRQPHPLQAGSSCAVSNEPRPNASHDPAGKSLGLKEITYWSKVDMSDAADVDDDDFDKCPEYSDEIFYYLRLIERREQFLVRGDFLSAHGRVEITSAMRNRLIDWLVKVQCQYRLLPDTLFLTINILDRYLQVKRVKRDRLQLVGVTSMLIAAKYEEVLTPEVEDFAFITEYTCSCGDIRSCEEDILRTLDYQLGQPLCLQFLRRFSLRGRITLVEYSLARYTMEISTLDYSLVSCLPSLRAAASYLLAKLLLNDFSQHQEITKDICDASLHTHTDVKATMAQIAKTLLFIPTTSLHAITLKYSTNEFAQISKWPVLQGNALQRLAKL